MLRQGQVVGAVRLTRPDDEVRALALSDATGLGLAAVAIVTLTVLAVAAAGRAVDRGFADIARAAHRAGDDVSVRVSPSGDLDSRVAGVAVNALLDHLDRENTRHREFLADAAHHLRTPLTAVRLRVEAAVDATDDPQVARQLDAADGEVLRLSRLLEDLLALARQAAPPPSSSRCILDEELGAAARRWRPVADESGRDLRVDAGAGLPAAGIAAGDLRTVIDNLIDNALSHGRGSVRVTSGRAGPGHLRVRVEDDGPGLTEDELHHCLERFWRGPDASTSGSGLGLSLVSAILERYGGRVDVSSGGGGLRVDAIVPVDWTAHSYA